MGPHSGRGHVASAVQFAMGMFQVNVTVANPHDNSRAFEEMFWVDTGALYTFVPEDRLHQIGIAPLRTRDLILADGFNR